MYKLMPSGVEIYNKDINYWDQVILPNIENNQKPIIFSSIIYLTPNFMNLLYLKKLAELSNQGFKIILLIWDTNALKYKENEKLYPELKSEEEFFNHITEEVTKIFSYYNMKTENLVINRASKAWKKLVLFENQSLFSQYYNTLMDFKNSDFDEEYKISHLLQMPMDIFIGINYHKLYPEHIKDPISLIFSGDNKKNIYIKIREKMYDTGIINMKKPIFLFYEKIPYLRYDGLIPEWNMSLDEINFLISNLNPNIEEIKKIFKYLAEEENKFEIQKGKKTYSLKEIYSYLTKCNQKTLNKILSLNLFKFFEKIKNDLPEIERKLEYLEIDKFDEIIKISNLLKNKTSLKIIELSNGDLNLTQMSKAINKQISNTSIHVKNLKKLGLIKQNKNGKLKKSLKSIILNL